MMKEIDKALSGENFICNDAEIMEVIRNARYLTKLYNQSDFDDKTERQRILKNLFGTMSENVTVDTPLYCDYGRNIHIGSNVIININCTFVDCNRIDIGDNVLIASNVQMYTSTHSVLPKERLVDNWSSEMKIPFFTVYARPIKIGNNVWIGGGAIILPGVTIGDNAVIGAGSVVNKDIPPNSVAVGNPCKVIRHID